MRLEPGGTHLHPPIHVVRLPLSSARCRRRSSLKLTLFGIFSFEMCIGFSSSQKQRAPGAHTKTMPPGPRPHWVVENPVLPGTSRPKSSSPWFRALQTAARLPSPSTHPGCGWPLSTTSRISSSQSRSSGANVTSPKSNAISASMGSETARRPPRSREFRGIGFQSAQPVGHGQLPRAQRTHVQEHFVIRGIQHINPVCRQRQLRNTPAKQVDPRQGKHRPCSGIRRFKTHFIFVRVSRMNQSPSAISASTVS